MSTSNRDELPLTSATVLLQMPGGEPKAIDAIVLDPGFCIDTQIGVGLIEVGSRRLEEAEKRCNGGQCGGGRT